MEGLRGRRRRKYWQINASERGYKMEDTSAVEDDSLCDSLLRSGMHGEIGSRRRVESRTLREDELRGGVKAKSGSSLFFSEAIPELRLVDLMVVNTCVDLLPGTPNSQVRSQVLHKRGELEIITA